MKSKFLLAIIALFCSASLMSQNHSLTFNGIDEYVDCGSTINSSIDNQITISAWVYPELNTYGDKGIVSNYWYDSGAKGGAGIFAWQSGTGTDHVWYGMISNASGGVTSVSSSFLVSLNQWTHVAMTYDNNTLRLFVNGVEVATNNCGPGYLTDPTNDNPFHIAKHSYSDLYFNGKMDEVRIWSSVRTQAEIRANMYNELAGTETGLVAYYKMDETEGELNTTLPCSASTPQDATLVYMDNSNLETSPAFYGPGNCLEFDGSSNFVSVPHNSSLNINSTVTVEAWVNFTDVDKERPVVVKNGGAYYLYASPPGYAEKAGFFIEGVSSNWLVSTTSINDGLWHHIAGTYDGSNIKIFVDGVLENSTTGSGHATNSNQDLTIGYRNNDYLFKGKLDEVRIWNIALDQNDIAKNMNRQLTGNEDGLIAYYNFNNDLLGTLQDFSPNANDGTLTNMDASTDWVASEAYNTWLNTSSTDWGTATNWSSGSIPDDSDNVGIYCASNETNPVLGNNLECNHLVISTENTLEIENTVHRTIHGSVFNVFNTRIKDNTELTITGSLYMLHNSSVTLYPSAQLTIGRNLHTRWLGLDGTFTVKSDATGSGSLIVDGSSTGDVDFECYLSGESLAWHTYSAPVNSESIAGSSFDPGSGTDNDFYLWNEPAPGTWVNFKNQDGSGGEPNFPTANGGNNNFISGKGYLLAYNEASPIKTIAGDINTDAVNITLKNSSSAKHWTYASGWNLIGNPFSSAIDWNIVDHDAGTSLFQDVYAYAYDQTANEDAGDYVLIDGSQANAFIPAQQGFFVLAKQSSNDQTFSFAKTMKVHANNNVYKSGSTSYDLELLLTGDSFSDETWINIHENSSTERDHLDALKLFSFNTASPALYSLSENDVKLAINTLPDISEGSSIHLGYKVPVAETYSISINQINSSNITTDIYLEDKYENNVHNLSKSDYNFTSAEGEFADRFVLHFGTTAIDDELQETNPMCAFAAGDAITFINNSDQEGIIKITSVNGMLLYQGNISKQSSKKLSQNFASGIYIGSIETEGFCRSTKLIVSGF